MKTKNCIICNKNFESYGKNTCSPECSHINRVNINKNRYLKNVKLCNVCGKPNLKQKYGNKTCSVECGKIQAQQKRKSTCLEKYGFEQPTKNIAVKEKYKKTCLEKYGETSHLKSNKITEKRRKTKLERYGEHPESFIYHNITKFNNFKKYGVMHPSQIPEIHDKQILAKKKWKDYILPSGKIVRLQGYEHYALNDILKTHSENDIIFHKQLDIWYNLNLENKRYFPDFYIPKDNLIIEVKSTYTITLDKEMIEAKKQRCLELGYEYQIWIYNDKGSRVLII